MSNFKRWEDLTITDDFMFCKVMSDPDICKELLEILLHIKIERLVFQEPQKSFRLTSESRGIRLDVYVKDSNRVFDIELQTTNERNLELRTRYYQGVMDISELEKGDFFSNMKESYIIFICMFDPFGADIPIYTVKQTFAENDKLIFNDKTHKIFYNVKAFEKIANDVETKAFLEYLCKHQSTTKFTQSLETAVYRNKNNQNWRKDYMTLAYNLSLAAEKAFENGFSAGEERGRNEGISIGLSQGITQGEHKKAVETAKKFLAMGLSVEQVATGTGLSVEEIEKL
ncbi:MAG: Rpn family recombination-promoting nuclease/putative transposase [Spirochaetales bacterium]|nr:Rpn family recombination-promoting nuclease/putative transposase [Spirochaetales bacterium]